MVRKLHYHEEKLLKKHDFVTWSVDNEGKQNDMMRKYKVTKREHYALYNSLARQVREIADHLKELAPNDPFRLTETRKLLGKLYSAGIIASADSLELLGKVSGSSFARRRLPVVMKRSRMVGSVGVASDLVEQGHVRVGVHLVTDPAFFVSRPMEDHITWTAASTIRQQVNEYNHTRDDYDLA